MKTEYQIIGKSTPLIDGYQKVTGEALYTDDIKLPNMLVGKILRSPHPHAKIIKLDVSKAEALPGVHAIVTGKEAPTPFGVLPISKDETAMAIDKVIYVGDCVAGVAADDEETAIEALKLIEIEYQPLKAYINPEDSLQQVPEDERIHAKTLDGTNIHKSVDQQFGDVEVALKQSSYVKTASFEYAGINHAATEPHCVIAQYDSQGRLTLWTPTQVPHYVHRALSEVMGMDMHRIRVIRPYIGGAFGGKSDPFPHEMICALLARKCGRPVKILFDREEVFLTHHGRHPTKNTVSIGLDKEGMITAYDINALIDGGAWGSFGVVTTYYNGTLTMGPYTVPAFRYSGRRVYTNKPASGAMRGHGAVNVRYSTELVMDMLAEEAKIDPIELRLKNALAAHTTTINQFRITSNGFKECLERVREASGWKKKFKQMPFGRGIGIGCGFFISGSALPIHRTKIPQSTVHLKVDMDGGVTLHNMASEIGQGSNTMLAQCVAEPLGIPLKRVRVYSSDSDMAPVDFGSYSSRETFMAGNAARNAGLVIAEELKQAASRLTGKPAEYFILRDEKVIYSPPSGPSPTGGEGHSVSYSVSYMEAITEAIADRGALIAKGIYQSPKLGGAFKGAAAGLSPAYSFQAFVAEVEVDLETGFVKVIKMWAAHDVGKALNPMAVEGQIEGSIHMGLGQVLSEDFAFNNNTCKGNLVNPNLLDYKILSPHEMPDVEVIIVESNDAEGPYGAKECGEGALAPVLPAVGNAIFDAIGIRILSLPITPDKILDALEAKNGNGRIPSFNAIKPISFPVRNYVTV